MAGIEEEGKRPGKFIIQNGQGGEGTRREGAIGAPLAPLMREDVLSQLSYTPIGRDPLFYPLYILNEVRYHISTRNDPASGPAARALGKKYAPYQESIRKVRTAYAILAYPHFTSPGWQHLIEGELETDRQMAGRDQVELTADERLVLRQLTAAKNLPFDPERTVYSYSEVPISPDIDPFGRRHLSTEEIRKLREELD